MAITFKTAHPGIKLNLTLMILLEVCLLISLAVNRNSATVYFTVGVILIVFAYIAVMIKRGFFTKLSITLEQTCIISPSHVKYESDRIECIYIRHKKIGCKVRGKRWVPVDLFFCFDKEQEEEGLSQLKKWAGQNDIEIKSGFFRTLM